jgi:hypothetical protein
MAGSLGKARGVQGVRGSLAAVCVGVGVLAAATVACGSSGRAVYDDPANPANPGATPPVGDGGPPGAFTPTGDGAPLPANTGCEKMDIVFVIDDSGSMEEEQSNLASNFPKFVSVLDAIKTGSGAQLDYRVAVTTTGKTYSLSVLGIPVPPEKGDDGKFRNNCGGPKRWLDRSEAAASFPCRARVGTNGPSEEMPLECMKLALVDRMADNTNAGFLRDDALLAVVFLTDEDDCSIKASTIAETIPSVCETSAEKPESYVAVLDAVKGDRARWATAVIAGKTKCSSSFGEAAEAKRLGQFVTATGKNAVFSSICDGDLSQALKDALDKFGEACKAFPGVPR